MDVSVRASMPGAKPAKGSPCSSSPAPANALRTGRLAGRRARRGCVLRKGEWLGLAGVAAPRGARELCVAAGALRDSSDETREQIVDEQVEEQEASVTQILADLDAVLGVDPDEEEGGEGEREKDAGAPNLAVDVGPEVLAKIAEAERLKSGGSGVVDASDSKVKDAAEQIANIVDKVKSGEAGSEESLKKEFERLVELLKPEESEKSVRREDCAKIKKEVFGAETFWVTEVVPNDDIIGGMLFKGNLRGEVDAVYEKAERGVRDLFAEKYELLVVDDPEAEMEFMDAADPEGRPRVAFLLLPSAIATPPTSTGLQKALGVVLALLLVGTALQVGVSAELALVPKEVISALLKPDSLTEEQLQATLSGWDPVPLVKAAWPIAAGIVGGQVAHDVGHRVAAAAKGVKLGFPFFIPNGQIGSLGSITQYKSLARNRTDMFDIAYAGLAAGGAVASALFLSGLILSTDQDASTLLPIPSVLFNGSVLLGSLSKTFLGAGAVSKAQVMVHPNLIAGWCGLITTAFNALPVGSLDGGRMVQSAYGKKALNVFAVLTYAGLGFGLLGSTLSLPFGLYVLFCQRTPEQYLKNHVTGTDTNRALLCTAVLAFAFVTLLPILPSELDLMTMGPPL